MADSDWPVAHAACNNCGTHNIIHDPKPTKTVTRRDGVEIGILWVQCTSCPNEFPLTLFWKKPQASGK